MILSALGVSERKSTSQGICINQFPGVRKSTKGFPGVSEKFPFSSTFIVPSNCKLMDTISHHVPTF